MKKINENQKSEELHDLYPKLHFIRLKRIIILTWIILLGLDTYFFINIFRDSLLWVIESWIFWIFFVFNIAVPFGLYFLEEFGKVASLWDNYDYSPITKKDLHFVTSDGIHLRAYQYTPKSINFDQDFTPKPAIIGLHGFNNHHREMDRYCLPTVFEENCLYFTYDVRGHGKSSGKKADLHQFEETKEFIDFVKALPYVDKNHIAVVGMSMGANRAAVSAYPDSAIKVIVMLSGPFDLKYTFEKMKFLPKLWFSYLGVKPFGNMDNSQKYSGLYQFLPDGVILENQSESFPNDKRVFLAACEDDIIVNVENTLLAIKKLNLPPTNYRIFKKGGHNFEGNEWTLAAAIFKFISTHL